MELDQGLPGTVCFTKGKCLLIRPLKISSQQEQRILHFTGEHKKSALSEMFPEQRKPCASSRMGSAFPGVCCPVQRTGGSSAGSQPPTQGAALPCTLREGCLWGAWLLRFAQRGCEVGGQCPQTTHHVGVGRGHLVMKDDFGILA